VALTVPVADGSATDVFEDVQFTGRLERTVPVASRTVAVNRVLSPTVIVALVGVRLTDAAGTAVTVTATSAVSPSADAWMTVEPIATPVTLPLEVTEATALLSLDHDVGGFGMRTPAASRSSATSCALWLTVTDAVDGLMLRVVGVGAVTVREFAPTVPSLIALMVTTLFARAG
jgi:hypothetical protein